MALVPRQPYAVYPKEATFIMDLRWFCEPGNPDEILERAEASIKRFVKDSQVVSFDDLPPDGFSRLDVVFPQVTMETAQASLDIAMAAMQLGYGVYDPALALQGISNAAAETYCRFNPAMVEVRRGRGAETPSTQSLDEIWPGSTLFYSMLSPLVKDSVVLGCFVQDMEYVHQFYSGIERVSTPVNHGTLANRFRAIRLYMAVQYREMPCNPEFVLAWSDLLYRSGFPQSEKLVGAKTKDMLRRCDSTALQELMEDFTATRRFQFHEGDEPSLRREREAHLRVFKTCLEAVMLDRGYTAGKSAAESGRRKKRAVRGGPGELNAGLKEDEGFVEIFSP